MTPQDVEAIHTLGGALIGLLVFIFLLHGAVLARAIWKARRQ